MDKKRLEELKKIQQEQKKKDKSFQTMNTNEKWKLVEAMAKMLGLIQ